jgi:fluoride exporter
MNQAILIFIGGGLGSLARFFVGKNMPNTLFYTFPIATLIVNVAASFILGIFIGQEISAKLDFNYRALIAIGFCGGFSTFSTFSADTLQLLQANRYYEALMNLLLNVVLCILATFVGIYLIK